MPWRPRLREQFVSMRLWCVESHLQLRRERWTACFILLFCVKRVCLISCG